MGLSSIIGGILKPVGDYFNRRQEIKAVQHQGELEVKKAMYERQAELARQGLAADAAWEMEFAKQAATSWKDEYTLIVVSIPLVMAFIPGTAKYVVDGFASFSNTPIWYQLLVQAIFYATYGIRLWRRNQSDT